MCVCIYIIIIVIFIVIIVIDFFSSITYSLKKIADETLMENAILSKETSLWKTRASTKVDLGNMMS